MRPQPSERILVPPKLGALLELTGWLLTAAAGVLLVAFGLLSEEGCIWLATLMLVTLLFVSWRRFDGGLHPCFLFLGMLIIFQAGRPIAHVLGMLPDPMQIDVATAIPFTISAQAGEMTLLLIVLSGILVYIPCRLGFRPVTYNPGREMRWLPALYVLVLLTFPFALYKNWSYFAFIRAHGGYLAVYTDNAAVLQSAGTMVRTIALVNSTALLIAYVFERRRKRIFALLALYFALSTLDLLIGFRGKFFAQALGLWYIHKLKTGRRFNLLPLLSLAVVISLVAIVVAGFRQDQAIQLLSPIGFLAQQGVSLNVTEAAVAFHHIFSRYGAAYVFWGFANAAGNPVASGTHRLWTVDLTTFLNPTAQQLGFGTASSYLAELYLFGGITATSIGSLAIGCCLEGLHRISSEAKGALLLAILLPTIIYLPRSELLAPLGFLVKSTISFVAIAVLVLMIDAGLRMLRFGIGHAAHAARLPVIDP